MAVVKGFQKITGTIQNATFYTIQGSDKVYLRTKGGPSKSLIKRHPHFEKLRRNNSEWSGCTQMTGNIRNTLSILKPMEDYPVCGALNAISKQIQKTDLDGEHGKRGIYLSKNKELLGGFSASRHQVLESVLRIPINCTLDRETGSAQIALSAIDTHMQLYNFRKLPYFRLSMMLARVSDLEFSVEKDKYVVIHDPMFEGESWFHSEWLSTVGIVPAITRDFSFPKESMPLPDCMTMVLTFGLEFGKTGNDGKPETVKYAGCGKVMRVG